MFIFSRSVSLAITGLGAIFTLYLFSRTRQNIDVGKYSLSNAPSGSIADTQNDTLGVCYGEPASSCLRTVTDENVIV